MLTRRRKTSGEPKAARLQDIIARLVEFTVTLTDRAGKTSTSRFRVLTTLPTRPSRSPRSTPKDGKRNWSTSQSSRRYAAATAGSAANPRTWQNKKSGPC